jgi:hypothetical protein
MLFPKDLKSFYSDPSLSAATAAVMFNEYLLGCGFCIKQTLFPRIVWEAKDGAVKAMAISGTNRHCHFGR